MKLAVNRLALYFLFLCFFSTLYSCCKATISEELFYTNNTDNAIEIRFYKSGTFTTVVAKQRTVKEPFINYPADSILLYSNNILKETHYPADNTNPVSKPKSVRYSDPGNIFNYNNYSQEKIALKCNGYITKLTYVFNP